MEIVDDFDMDDAGKIRQDWLLNKCIKTQISNDLDEKEIHVDGFQTYGGTGAPAG